MKQVFRKMPIIAMLMLILAMTFFAACDNAGNGNDTGNDDVKPIYFAVSYTAGEGGNINGESEQSVLLGENAKTVTAVPDIGYEFSHWSDDETLLAVRQDIDVTSAITATAIFAKKQIQITYIEGENGTIIGELTQSVPYGENGKTVTAIPDLGYVFSHWSDDETIPAVRQDTNVTSAINATAIFKKRQIQINYIEGANGTIEGELTQIISFGENAKTVIAKPNIGYEFFRWSDSVTAYATRQDTNVTSAINATAIFKKKQIQITYIAGENGKINGEKTQTVFYGENAKTVTAVPNTGYEFLHWSDDETIPEIRQDTSVTQKISATAIFKKKQIQITYIEGENGTIIGEKAQTIAYGENGKTVIAVGNAGYEFSHWSDGATTAQRTDSNVTSAENLVAYFIKITRYYEYVYNNFMDNDQHGIMIDYETLHSACFVVPSKEYFTFGGWYLDKDYSVQVTDEAGNLVIGDEVFDVKSTYLYAKWNAIEQLTYKTLLVFVTEVEATLVSTHGESIDISYKMSDIERQICELTAFQLSKTLNDMMDGLVIFEIDTFFTTVPLGEESFSRGNNSGLMDHKIYNKIPELEGMFENYRSVITTFGMNDYDGILHSSSGSAMQKYASIHIESLLPNFVPLEILLDLNNQNWINITYLYIHELTHTMELYYTSSEIYEYHKALAYFTPYQPPYTDRLEVCKLYLLNQLIIDGKKVGISHSFWKTITKTFIYEYNGATANNAQESITLISTDLYTINFAIPTKEGYTFEGWYLEPDFKTQITHRQGHPLMRFGLFDLQSIHLYARWIKV